jgi:hypothetical protein
MAEPVGRSFLTGPSVGVLLAPQPVEICHLKNPLRSLCGAAGNVTPGCDSNVRAGRATSSRAARGNFCWVPGNSPVCAAD